MTTVVSILMSDIVPLRDRGVWQGIINIIYATGAGAGAPLGTKTLTFTTAFLMSCRWHSSRLHWLALVRPLKRCASYVF